MRKKTLNPVREDEKNPNLSDEQRDLLKDDMQKQRIIEEQLRVQDELVDVNTNNKSLKAVESSDELDFVEAADTAHSYDGRVDSNFHEEYKESDSIGSAFVQGMSRGTSEALRGTSRSGRLADLSDRLDYAASKENAANAEFANRGPKLRRRG